MKGVMEMPPVPLEHSMTISGEKRELYRGIARATQAQALLEERTASSHKVQQDGMHNVVLRDLADNTINEIETLMRRFTYDARREKTDIRADPDNFCMDCGRPKLACSCEQED